MPWYVYGREHFPVHRMLCLLTRGSWVRVPVRSPNPINNRDLSGASDCMLPQSYRGSTRAAPVDRVGHPRGVIGLKFGSTVEGSPARRSTALRIHSKPSKRITAQANKRMIANPPALTAAAPQRGPSFGQPRFQKPFCLHREAMLPAYRGALRQQRHAK